MGKKGSELEQWSLVAQQVNADELPAFKLPLHVLFGEAVDVAKFFEKYWATQVDAQGRTTRFGLESAVPRAGRKGEKGRFGRKTGDEILSLQRATQEAQTRFLLTIEKNANPRDRAEFLLGEIRATLGWFFDDGILDEKDEMLAQLDAAHENDPETADALASALDDYAHLAEKYRESLDGLGGFQAAYLDEGCAVAAELRGRPAQAEAMSAKAREALALRNKLAALLLDRMSLVRAAARFIFRAQPEIVREVTSAYERRKRAVARRNKEQPTRPLAPPAPPAPPVG